MGVGMNARKWISLALIFCGAASPAFAQTCGLIGNSGFESDLSGWSASGTVAIVSDAQGRAKGTGGSQTGCRGHVLSRRT